MVPRLTRRGLIQAAAALPLAAWAWPASAQSRKLVAGPARINLVGAPHPSTDVWTYDGAVPGPAVRIRQGETLRVEVENRLAQETTVHWHGIRLPNAMDGVPHLTQKPIAPGETFAYEFAAPDAGTYWYHPHARSFEQVARGLHGALIVEEPNPPPVDRDEVWVLADWRLDRQAKLADDFGNMMDLTHAGRVGNTVTINGKVPDTYAVRTGERIRLRLINAASARIFALEFKEHPVAVIAQDGQPVEPHVPDRVVLGPGMRADLVLDAIGKPGAKFSVIDSWYRQREYRLVDLAYGEAPLREAKFPPPPALPANAIPEPDLARAEKHRAIFTGGMMSGAVEATLDGEKLDLRGLVERGKAWAVNGVVARDHDAHRAVEPLLTLKRGTHCLIAMQNDTVWHHPMHLHGHVFRVVARGGKPTARREWADTVLMDPRESVDIAFVADNPGDWMFHCHILDHQQAGMTAHVRVS